MLVAASFAPLAGCGDVAKLPVSDGIGPAPKLPPPRSTLLPTVSIARAVGWTSERDAPVAAPGARVTAFARGLAHPRWLYVLPNGDVLVAESNKPAREPSGFREWVAGKVKAMAGAATPSADRITLLRDADGDGVAELRSAFLEGLHSPFGMALVGDELYVANADALLRVRYREGQTRADGEPERVTDLPAGRNHHWTKNVIASRDGRRLYVTVGSNSNVAENGMHEEEGRAAIWEIDLPADASRPPAKRLFATGLRNPNGMDWEPLTGELWTAVNERDEIGSDLVPDYVTSVRRDGFYGWPYSYYGSHVDERVTPQRPDLVARALVPDYALGPHTASLGIAFARGEPILPSWREGLYVAQHGSWNRRPKSGYKVVFVPFSAGRPDGPPADVLSGFLDADERAKGRPVGVALDGRGGLLVSDDLGDTVWRVGAAR
ncbi:MAG: sorbosone dehydrogenase family protein [Burkholderiaceae bacterium]